MSQPVRHALGLALVAVSLGGCLTNPHTGRRQLLLFSEERMIQMGAQAYAEMTNSSKVRISADAALRAPLVRVGRAIAAAARKPHYRWEFKLIDDPDTVNAWALPGGKIAFYTGIYPILQDEAGMAIVMGHEVMHALLRHGNERMSQSSAAKAILGGAAIGLEKSKYRDEILAALGVGASVGVLLPYSRSQESEADHYGLDLAARAGYDPRVAVRVWERMAEASAGRTPPEFLSTHPSPRRRIANMKEWMPEALKFYREAPVKRENRPLPRRR